MQTNLLPVNVIDLDNLKGELVTEQLLVVKGITDGTGVYDPKQLKATLTALSEGECALVTTRNLIFLSLVSERILVNNLITKIEVEGCDNNIYPLTDLKNSLRQNHMWITLSPHCIVVKANDQGRAIIEWLFAQVKGHAPINNLSISIGDYCSCFIPTSEGFEVFDVVVRQIYEDDYTVAVGFRDNETKVFSVHVSQLINPSIELEQIDEEFVETHCV